MRKLLPFNEDNFHNIGWKEGLAVVRFHAPWCPPCHSSENLFNEFDEIIKEINNNNCKKTIQLGKIAPDINKLRQLPVEIGELDFEIECKELKKTVSVKIIYTSVGWRILEKLRTKKH